MTRTGHRDADRRANSSDRRKTTRSGRRASDPSSNKNMMETRADFVLTFNPKGLERHKRLRRS